MPNNNLTIVTEIPPTTNATIKIKISENAWSKFFLLISERDVFEYLKIMNKNGIKKDNKRIILPTQPTR
tara:strand:- start:222 stop:428 length:207 start_codon:yes stop_codon:yes gene_type:complete